jgi:hypothetical protein
MIERWPGSSLGRSSLSKGRRVSYIPPTKHGIFCVGVPNVCHWGRRRPLSRELRRRPSSPCFKECERVLCRIFQLILQALVSDQPIMNPGDREGPRVGCGSGR